MFYDIRKLKFFTVHILSCVILRTCTYFRCSDIISNSLLDIFVKSYVDAVHFHYIDDYWWYSFLSCTVLKISKNTKISKPVVKLCLI